MANTGIDPLKVPNWYGAEFIRLALPPQHASCACCAVGMGGEKFPAIRLKTRAVAFDVSTFVVRNNQRLLEMLLNIAGAIKKCTEHPVYPYARLWWICCWSADCADPVIGSRSYLKFDIQSRQEK